MSKQQLRSEVLCVDKWEVAGHSRTDEIWRRVSRGPVLVYPYFLFSTTDSSFPPTSLAVIPLSWLCSIPKQTLLLPNFFFLPFLPTLLGVTQMQDPLF